MNRTFLLAVFSVSVSVCPAQATLSLLFLGDIMGHDEQIQSAFDPATGAYRYDGVFDPISPWLSHADFTIGNLEVTLGGPPYKGYPQFSSPDALALACKEAGMDLLVTANNHSCDRGLKGIVRTLRVLDSLDIPHTGTFYDPAHREMSNLLIIAKDGIRVGLLNYTYGTNGLPIPAPTIVNLIDTAQMRADIVRAKQDSLDKLIVMVHWGDEYQLHPNRAQVSLGEFLFRIGADVVIGGHPHVLQRMEYHPATETLPRERLIAYSLGNFVSNQRTRNRDGAATLAFTIVKDDDGARISQAGYLLHWVYKHTREGRLRYEVLPCAEYENRGFPGLGAEDREKMQVFISDSRALLNQENIGIPEMKAPPH